MAFCVMKSCCSWVKISTKWDEFVDPHNLSALSHVIAEGVLKKYCSFFSIFQKFNLFDFLLHYLLSETIFKIDFIVFTGLSHKPLLLLVAPARLWAVVCSLFDIHKQRFVVTVGVFVHAKSC